MAFLTAVVTDDARKYWSQFLGQGLLVPPGVPTLPGTRWDHRIKTFKYGEGGWTASGGGPVRRAPDPGLRLLVPPSIQDVDAIVDPTRPLVDQRYPSDGRFVFEKVLVPADFAYVAPTSLTITCFLDFTESNNDGYGFSPEFWEVGLFADHPIEVGEKLMVAYGTFPKQIKDASKTLSNVVKIIY